MTFDDFRKDHAVKKEQIDTIERDNLYRDDGRVPHVPFGFGNKKWLKFKQQMLPGDEIYHFNSSAESWRNLAGREGYVLVRGVEVVDEFVTTLN